MIGKEKLGFFASGVLFGTAGIAILASKEAKKVYTVCTAAALRGRDKVLKTANTVIENCGDIYAEASDMNAEYAEKTELEAVAKAEALIEGYREKKAAAAEEAEKDDDEDDDSKKLRTPKNKE